MNLPPYELQRDRMMAQQVRPERRKPITTLALEAAVHRLASAPSNSIMARSCNRSTEEAADTTAVSTRPLSIDVQRRGGRDPTGCHGVASRTYATTTISA